jgi:hypothetical protein
MAIKEATEEGVRTAHNNASLFDVRVSLSRVLKKARGAFFPSV